MTRLDLSDADREDRAETLAKEEMRERRRRSGFCNPSNDADSHRRCSDHVADCGCGCHLDPTTEAPSGDIAAGFHFGLDEGWYHAHPTSLSVSGAKTLLKAPALFRWEREHTVFKKAFEFGSAAHAKVLGIGAEIRVIPDDILAANGATSTKEAKAFIEEARAAGAVPLKSAEARKVEDMADKISGHSLAMELLSEGQPEVSAFAIDESTGVMRRGRFDWLGSQVLTDYKTSTTADPKAFRSKAADFGYHQQAAWYLDLARDLDHPAVAFAFVVQMKEPPYLVTVVELVDRAVDRGRELNRRALEMYRDCSQSGRWPGYVPDNEFAQIDLPGWAYNDNEIEISA